MALAQSEGQPAPSIQALIDSAHDGDVINLPEGVFAEQIVLKDGVTLVGAPGGKTVIDGTGKVAVVTGAQDSLLSNLTIIGGKVGIDTHGAFMGVVDCTIKGSTIMGIHVCGNSALIINNLLDGGSICCNSSCPAIICNTVVKQGGPGIWTWYAPGPKIFNNLIVGAKLGVHAGAGSAPALSNNAFWNNKMDQAGCDAGIAPIKADPLFVKPETGDYTLQPSSPLISAGCPVDGLWGGEKPDVGRNVARKCSIGDCRKMMESMSAELVARGKMVTYSLGETPGEFLVTLRHSRRKFSISSSTSEAVVSEIEAFDQKGIDPLRFEFSNEPYPGIRVQLAAPGNPVGEPESIEDKPVNPDVHPSLSQSDPLNTIDNRYILRKIYHAPDSYFDSGDVRIFKRKTNIGRVAIEIPAGYTPIFLMLNGNSIRIPEKLEFVDRGDKEIELGLRKQQVQPGEPSTPEPQPQAEPQPQVEPQPPGEPQIPADAQSPADAPLAE
ncbi:MAG: right-handed parallel beta-helix repeat-containing protein [Candidatus Aureabacteria bacterium]|nr:right-handed parallel beta-helix repeat-containing protein [Candidatus Auribacterota bacterium]